MIYKLTYESNACVSFDELGIDRILEQARDHNKVQNITGCLVYHNGAFVQILEGDREEVNKLFQIISKDVRHSNVRLVSEEMDEERSFSDWNMAYFDPHLHGLNKADIANFEKNLLLLADFSERLSTTVNLFWINVRKIILNLKIS
ncbi:BLUF domain-containing protein [Euzebyella saccharophila]|uniref:BLUF domain-containing protein n=1 Tax=Euzebyella saccharophila TaxID=679664 RepID=A0ABV8JT34_9FLAO|nr:BLUF domain-containing protein [Euzebyella saccharophila]